MKNPAKFWNKVAKRYARSPIKDEASYQKKLEVTQTYFKPGMNVLEFGCGTGGTARMHAPHVRHIRAIDFSENMVEIAKAKAKEENIANVEFEVASIDTLSVPDESFDAVLGLSILHLLENKEEIMEKIYKMLKPNGIFVTSTACLGDGMSFFRFIGPVGRFLGVLPFLDIFTQQELEEAIIHAGFKIDYNWHPEGKMKAVFIVAKKMLNSKKNQ